MKSVFLWLFIIWTPFLLADDESQETSDIIVLRATEVIEGDYFAYGKSIEISGTVNGDVYVFGGQVFIDGNVNGNVLAIAGSINLTGDVTQDVRLMAGQVMIGGNIGRTVSIIAGNAELFPSASIGRNVAALCGNIDLAAEIKKNVRVYASNLRVSNKIGGRLLAYVGQMRISSKTRIDEDVEYWSNDDAVIDSQAVIVKGVEHHPSFFYYFFKGRVAKGLKIGSQLATLLMNFFYTFFIGIILMRYFPQKIERSVAIISARPLQVLFGGIVLLVVLPLACLVLLISILGVPFALTLMATTVIGLYTVKIFPILWLTKLVLRKVEFEKHRKLYFLMGLIIYFGITLIPYLGIVVAVVTTLFGLGSVILSKAEQVRR